MRFLHDVILRQQAKYRGSDIPIAHSQFMCKARVPFFACNGCTQYAYRILVTLSSGGSQLLGKNSTNLLLSKSMLWLCHHGSMYLQNNYYCERGWSYFILKIAKDMGKHVHSKHFLCCLRGISCINYLSPFKQVNYTSTLFWRNLIFSESTNTQWESVTFFFFLSVQQDQLKPGRDIWHLEAAFCLALSL